MNDEINEILDNPKILMLSYGNYISLDDYIKLKDYITNLQQKIKHYEETTTFGDYVNEVNLLVDYKSRIEKAVEYIKRFDLIIGYYDYNDEGYDEIGENNNLQEELINILNGRSDE